MAWNMLAREEKGKPYLIKEFMATTLNEEKFKRLQEINPEVLGGYHFIPQRETDFSWWSRCFKKLTNTKIVYTEFDIDYYGKVKELK